VEEQSRFTGNDFKVAANDMVEAVLHIHSKGVIHRDVKPENFVVSQQHAGRVFMIDFGIAKYIGEDVAQRPLDNLTKQKEFVGPQAFCSPELLRYARDKAVLVDARSDLFQLGKVLWFMATGMVSAGIPSKRLDPFKGSLHALVSALLSDDPDDRVVGDLKVAVANL
jgi:serine/threonine protein kinase